VKPKSGNKDTIPAGFTLRHTLRAHTDVILHLTWSPDGKLLGSTSVDKAVLIWDASSGEQVGALRGHSAGVNDVAWSPNRQLIASSSFDRTVRIWSAETWEELRRLEDHGNDVPSISWSPDGAMLASGSIDETVCIWNAGNWEIGKCWRGSPGMPVECTASPGRLRGKSSHRALMMRG
jgi:WD40 repeat protein